MMKIINKKIMKMIIINVIMINLKKEIKLKTLIMIIKILMNLIILNF